MLLPGPARDPHARKLDLPPMFRLVSLREAGNAFSYARGNAALLGAGALVFTGRFGLAEFAVVLEPDEPFVTARCVFYACMTALGDALAAPAPPEKPIAIEWPGSVFVDDGLVGGGRLGWPVSATGEAPPEWLVFGAVIRSAFPAGVEPGLHPRATALEEEGFGDASPGRIVEGFARHLMVTIDRWREEGFAPIAAAYLSRLKPEKGAHRNIGRRGDLTIKRAGAHLERRELLRALAAPSWLDPKTGEPQL